MTTSFNFGIDWRRKGLICWDARPGDALNLLPSPLIYSTLGYRFIGTGENGLYPSLTAYGIKVFYQLVDTGLSSGVVLGQDAALAADDIPVQPSTTYSIGVCVDDRFKLFQ